MIAEGIVAELEKLNPFDHPGKLTTYIGLVPAQVQVLQTVRKMYACKYYEETTKTAVAAPDCCLKQLLQPTQIAAASIK